MRTLDSTLTRPIRAAVTRCRHQAYAPAVLRVEVPLGLGFDALPIGERERIIGEELERARRVAVASLAGEG
jgi:hypothetical protein